MTEQNNTTSTSSSSSSVPPLFYQQEQQQEQQSTNTNTSTIQRKSKRKRIQKVIQTTFLTIMNAAVTIFGVGVGVGLILGDSFRGRERVGGVTSVTVTASTSTRVGEGVGVSGPTIEGVIQRDGGGGGAQIFSTATRNSSNMLPAQ